MSATEQELRARNSELERQIAALQAREAMSGSSMLSLGNSFPTPSLSTSNSGFAGPLGGMRPAGYGGTGAMQPVLPMGSQPMQPMGIGANHPRSMDAMRSSPMPITNGAAGGSQPWRGSAPYIPSHQEVQNMQSVAPADPFSFAEKVFQDFAAGN
jgi:hypothetical protein